MSLVVTDQRAADQLFVAWQDPMTERYHPVAVLRHNVDSGEDCYTFRYLKNAEELDGFAPFVAFPALNVEYRSPRLFSFFTNRIMSSGRADYPQFIESLGLADDAGPLDILSRWGGRATDRIEVFAEPEIGRPHGVLRTRFFVRGIRHLDGAEQMIDELPAGGRLELVLEPTNPVNPWALQVATERGTIIGRVPDFLVGPLHRAVGDALDQIDVVIERVNPVGSPRETRVLCRLEASVPDGFAPFDGPDFALIDATPEPDAAIVGHL